MNCELKYIDTHSHLYSEQFDDDRDEVVRRAVEVGVGIQILPAISAEYHGRMMDVVERYEGLYATIGVHPTDIKESYREELSIVKDYLDRFGDKFVAIGEIGLDLYWDRTFFEQQVEALEAQLRWCIEHNLPAIIHTRDAYPEMIAVMEHFEGSGLRAVFHSFSGTVEQAQRLLAMGDHMLGIGGVVTFKKSTLIEVVRSVGIAKIVLETDAPYLAPVPYRGKRNESSYVPLVAQHIATELGMTVQQVAEQTTINARNMFSL